MTDPNHPTRIESIDWHSLFPFLHLFKSFRITLFDPAKMILALVLVVTLCLFGWVLDAIWGPQVYSDEITAYQSGSYQEFDQWRSDQDEESRRTLRRIIDFLPKDRVDQVLDSKNRYRQAIAAVEERFAKSIQQLSEDKDSIAPRQFEQDLQRIQEQKRRVIQAIRQQQPRGIFESSLKYKLLGLERMLNAASSLRFGFADLMLTTPHRSDTVIGALRDLVGTLPGWLYHTHRYFLLVYLLGALSLWSLLGGAIARLCALEATKNQRSEASAAITYARRHWISYFVTPLLPVVGIILIGLLMGLMGFVFFNVEVLDIAGGLVFGLALLGGLIIAILAVGLAASYPMLFPAIAVDGSEPFDALSRAFNYVLGRPWRAIFYHLVALVYGAITYLFLSVVVFLTLLATHDALAQWVFRTAKDEQTNRLTAILPRPEIGRLIYDVDWSMLGVTGAISAALVKVWVFLMLGLLGAYAVCLYFSLQTWIYLLLRRVADGTEFDDVFEEQPPPPPPPDEVPDKVEPAAAAEAPAPPAAPSDSAGL